MGGVAGHMAHLSEDLDLTFSEIINILGKVANADIKNATEKVDGQNLFLTVDNAGSIRTARNNTDIEKGGMTTEEYISKWKGHPAEYAFTNGFKATTNALKSLDAQTLQELFSGGERYINMEIMYPKNPNIIHYTTPQIVLHGLKYFGNLKGDDLKAKEKDAKKAFNKLVDLVDLATAEIGKEIWTINGPKVIELKKLADDTALEKVTSEIEKFAEPVGINATLKDLVKLYMRRYATKQGIPIGMIDSLILLSLDPDIAKERGVTVNSLKKGLPKELKPVVSEMATKTNSRKFVSAILQPIEKAISDFAIEVLRGIKSFFVDRHDVEVMRMRGELDKSINYLKSLAASGDEKMGELVDRQLAKLGNIENLASSLEGIVFEYPPGSDNIYKLTGAFAMANQIIGRARRSGMTERLADKFTVKISGDKEISKSLSEWLDEIKEAKHEYAKLPGVVYEDILNGGAIVDIVEEANALSTIYNTVLTHINTLNQEEGLEEEMDEDLKNVIALVPGAFKPPHQGHAEMVEQYAVEADKVIVLISKPVKSARKLANGRAITAEDSASIWKILTKHLPNVDIEISGHASPVTATYEFVSEEGPLEPGTEVILGVCAKGKDIERFRGIEKYAKSDIELRSLSNCAVSPVEHSSEYMELLNMSPLKNDMPSVLDSAKDPSNFHASDMRYLLGKATEDEEALELLEDFVGGPHNVVQILSILSIDTGLNEPLGETSSMGGGAIEGAPFGLSIQDRKRKRKKSIYYEPELYKEVLELIMSRGILK
jgi:cytidyltransferase-like protein